MTTAIICASFFAAVLGSVMGFDEIINRKRLAVWKALIIAANWTTFYFLIS